MISERKNISVRDTLFGDLPISQWPQKSSVQGEPWQSFIAARDFLPNNNCSEAVRTLQRILIMPELESRHYLQAWQFLRDLGVEPPSAEAKHLYGVVVEVAMENGLDILAAYKDRTARYYNYSGSATIWERPDQSLDQIIDKLLDVSDAVVAQIGVWENSRPPVPAKGKARINLLTPSGLHFGEGQLEALASDWLSGPVINVATKLMLALIDKKKKGQR